MSFALCLCSVVNGESSCSISLCVHDEKRAGYASLRMVLMVATACLVSNDARLYRMILHILVTVLRLCVCCALLEPVELCITPRYLTSPLGVTSMGEGIHWLVVKMYI